MILSDSDDEYGIGSILQRAVCFGLDKVVSYVLEKGANIAEDTFAHDLGEYGGYVWNSLELAIIQHTNPDDNYGKNYKVFELLKEKSLEKYSTFGLHPIHIECAIGVWSEIEKYLDEPGIVNKTIAVESPLWGGITPLLITAKFYLPFDEIYSLEFGKRIKPSVNYEEIISRLLDHGASPKARDSEGRDSLHYLYLRDSFDERLFTYEDDSTSKYISQFHIACAFCPKTLDIVKNHLERGFSPNLKIKDGDYNEDRFNNYNDVALHISVRINRRSECCIDLTNYYWSMALKLM